MAEIDYDKYITFNRKELKELLNPERFFGLVNHLEIKDAVVIRRQDQFASPCLLTYATMMAMVAKHYPEEEVRQELQIIADYFHTQGVLAGEEGWKFPTP